MNIKYFINNWKNIKEENISFTTNEWEEISSYQSLSEEFIEKYKNKVDWFYISKYQSLSEEFIEKHEDKVDWLYISQYQSLSEDFIEKYEDKVDWYYISIYQNLSIQFIFKYKNKISHLNCLNKHYRLRYEKYDIRRYQVGLSIHSNNSYGLIINWKNQMNIKNIPSNIIFCKTL